MLPISRPPWDFRLVCSYEAFLKVLFRLTGFDDPSKVEQFEEQKSADWFSERRLSIPSAGQGLDPGLQKLSLQDSPAAEQKSSSRPDPSPGPAAASGVKFSQPKSAEADPVPQDPLSSPSHPPPRVIRHYSETLRQEIMSKDFEQGDDNMEWFVFDLLPFFVVLRSFCSAVVDRSCLPSPLPPASL